MSIPNSELDLQLPQHNSLLNLVLSYRNVPAERPLPRASDVTLRERATVRIAIETLDSRGHYSILFSIAGPAGVVVAEPAGVSGSSNAGGKCGKSTRWAYCARPHPISGSPGRGGSRGVAPDSLQQL